MNRLQGIDNRTPLFVSLNPKRTIAPELVFDTAEFDHPVFDTAALAAQARVASPPCRARRGTWFAGAHLGHGFHEDGLASAVAGWRGGWAQPFPGTPMPPITAPQQKARPPVRCRAPWQASKRRYRPNCFEPRPGIIFWSSVQLGNGPRMSLIPASYIEKSWRKAINSLEYRHPGIHRPQWRGHGVQGRQARPVRALSHP